MSALQMKVSIMDGKRIYLSASSIYFDDCKEAAEKASPKAIIMFNKGYKSFNDSDVSFENDIEKIRTLKMKVEILEQVIRHEIGNIIINNE